MSEQLAELDPKIPVSVLDKVIKLSQENNESYSQMVAAVDTLASNSMGMADSLEKLSKTIEDEQLATVMQKCTETIRTDVDAMRTMVGVLSVPKYNILAAIAQCLDFEKQSEQEVMNKAKAVLWFLDLIGVFQRNKFLFSFALGAILVAVLGSAGMKVKDILLFIISHI